MSRSDDKTLYVLPDGTEALLDGTCGEPFSILGRHNAGAVDIVRVFYPDARRVRLVIRRTQGGWAERAMRRIDDTGLYVGYVPAGASYRLRITWADGVEETEDPYAFPPLLSERELELFSSGRATGLDRIMGAHPMQVDAVAGVRFAVWAPHARRVSVIGDFNIWDGRRHPMRLRPDVGIWEIFIPGLGPGERYKYEILDAQGRIVPHKSDPFARQAEIPPATASVIGMSGDLPWTDEVWMRDRARRQADNAPITIYALHAPSWRRPKGDPALTMSWDELAAALVPHVQAAGFTHAGFLPVMEHPTGWSWGGVPLGLFCPSARHGPPDGFGRLVDACHGVGIGVILDWIPDRLPPDLHGIACFDGTALYEHPHPRPHDRSAAEGTPLSCNLGRPEVRGFLIASALMWLEHYHVDGLRVDLRGYTAEHRDEIAAFMRELNMAIAQRVPDALVIASGGLPGSGITMPVERGGYGFSFEWNRATPCGLRTYLEHDPQWRGQHHGEIIAQSAQAFSEKYILCHSHADTAHATPPLLSRFPGDAWRRHATLRIYLSFLWAWPGKKLAFMGQEFAPDIAWNPDGQLPWETADLSLAAGTRRMAGDLNRLYRACPALHRGDCVPGGFAWVIADDMTNSVFAWIRHDPDNAPVLIMCNMTPEVRHDYHVGVPHEGYWHEIFNSDAIAYGGSGVGNGGGVQSRPYAIHGHGHACVLTLPPLGVLYLSMARVGS
ncbi:1,4-alpha-glucan branching enzyme [Gluconacetobacter entanii]|uniref:1,4-alpha-glucan branching enzyme n=1 Tax=Gluconacetobacter entanii TaxID=108528 RepID=UPI001C9361D3|nr:1,4-alpha-glucan branching enzyme [Gluconacetobacter entanii]MBY4641667.1 1,4-alpha-glucan branching enzyme [Gluconacetobacter entanii]MCW4581138.1 1,4-alpha-glucan branching enzyme [Gluconacetobacter entanii]MCW4584398.1 1,4-alpha-glucan branching enzyme [Gluconacetobacter entanii]MCW4587812.1 1,4-alpha-glucan branching enzyme [Gluconacetobacter entanii]